MTTERSTDMPEQRKETTMPDITNPQYEFDDLDRELMGKVRLAVQFDRDGDQIKDVIDEADIAEALALLVRIVDGEA